MPSPLSPQVARRRFLAFAGAAGAAIASACRRAAQPAGLPSLLGKPVSRYGDRSPHEKALRHIRETTDTEAASSRTPLAESHGIITPSSLHFERHHAGVPAIDPAEHELVIHGLVERPLAFSVEELKRLPSVSRILFIECSGNSGSEFRRANEIDVQRAHGLTSCSEWTGVPLALLLGEAGVKSEASWILAEGADACKLARSLPLEHVMRDALVAYGQNGEALRPEQGYPLRLIAPGFEGNVHVKWLRRVKVVDRPQMTRWETSKYTDLMPDGSARQFTFVMEAKSVITQPSGGQRLAGAGVYEITGLAWSGRGAITRVEVSTDGGATWHGAELQSPVLPFAHTRFRRSWRWDGAPAVLQSRCMDETGYVQPTRAELLAVRGVNSNYHNNGIQSWKVDSDGSVRNA